MKYFYWPENEKFTSGEICVCVSVHVCFNVRRVVVKREREKKSHVILENTVFGNLGFGALFSLNSI